MAMNNRDRVGKVMDLLAEGLHDVVDETMTKAMRAVDWNEAWALADLQKFGPPLKTITKHDVQTQLRAITEEGFHFKDLLSRAQQGFAR
jgi:hypothetical protein